MDNFTPEEFHFIMKDALVNRGLKMHEGKLFDHIRDIEWVKSMPWFRWLECGFWFGANMFMHFDDMAKNDIACFQCMKHHTCLYIESKPQEPWKPC